MADSQFETVGRIAVTVLAVVVTTVVGYVVFVRFPGSLAELIGVVLTLSLVGVAVRTVGSVWESAFPSYNTAEVAVEGPITRDAGGVGPTSSDTGADEVVEQIEAATDDESVDALLVKLNTPGGEIVPSEEIREAVVAFDGPTVGYATDLCASGGVWIASGCDEVWAREGSRVGSVGVIGLLPSVRGFFEDRNATVEEFTAGEYKDAFSPVTEFTDDDREYIQGLTDGFYDQFVDRVAEGMDMEPAAVRDTEARLYLGADAADAGLVDRVGSRSDALDQIADRLGAEPAVEAFEPETGIRDRIGASARSVAYSAGAGVADQFSPEEFRL